VFCSPRTLTIDGAKCGFVTGRQRESLGRYNSQPVVVGLRKQD